jgi:prepilin-type N-terminal cleavage/methylation domain-containing protein
MSYCNCAIRNKKVKKGFTLIELIIVIAILGILSTIAIVKFNDYKDSAVINTLNNNEKILVEQFILLFDGEGKTVTGTSTKQNNLRDFLQDEIYEIIINPISKSSYILSTSNTASSTFEGAAIVVASTSTYTIEEVEEDKGYYPLTATDPSGTIEKLNGTIMVSICSDGYLVYSLYDGEAYNFSYYYF